MQNVSSAAEELAAIDKEYLSTGELAAMCGVTKHTIISAIERGLLKAQRTPGGHNRIRKSEVIEFMRAHNLLPERLIYKILVVDDEPFVRDLMQEVFEGEKYRIVHAASGYEAGKLAERERPDLILLDIMLPDVDGRMVCRHIREEAFGQDCRILAVTGMRDPSEIEGMYEAGIDDCITKPFSIDELRDKVRNLLETIKK